MKRVGVKFMDLTVSSKLCDRIHKRALKFTPFYNKYESTAAQIFVANVESIDSGAVQGFAVTAI